MFLFCCFSTLNEQLNFRTYGLNLVLPVRVNPTKERFVNKMPYTLLSVLTPVLCGIDGQSVRSGVLVDDMRC